MARQRRILTRRPEQHAKDLETNYRKNPHYRSHVSNPKRSQLTKKEWIERGDLIRTITSNMLFHKIHFVGLREMSLQDLRDVQKGINTLVISNIAYDNEFMNIDHKKQSN